jgi:uncharacterized membrane protein YozB (DUF420 family)
MARDKSPAKSEKPEKPAVHFPPIRGKRRRRVYSENARVLCAAFLIPLLYALFTKTASAATVWEKANEIMKDIYTQILTISTIAAIVTASVALLLMNFSKNGKTVDESRAWLKRIIITWSILNGLGFIMSYITPFFTGGKWTP